MSDFSFVAAAIKRTFPSITDGFNEEEIKSIWKNHLIIKHLPKDHQPNNIELTELFDRHRLIHIGRLLCKTQKILVNYIYKDSNHLKLVRKLDGYSIVQLPNVKRGAFITFKKENQVYFGWSLCMKSDRFNRHYAIAQAYSRANPLDGEPQVPDSIKVDLREALVRFGKYWKTTQLA